MASLDYFDPNTVEPSAPMVLLPPGEYPAEIVKSEMVPTGPKDAPTGKALNLEFDILDGEFKGRKAWSMLNLVNDSAQAVEIAQRDLSAICGAVGSGPISDSDALHFKPLIIVVKIKPAGPDKKGVHREAKNEIKGYKAPAATASRQPATRSAPATRPAASVAERVPAAERVAPPAAGPAAAAGAPWKRRAGVSS